MTTPTLLISEPPMAGRRSCGIAVGALLHAVVLALWTALPAAPVRADEPATEIGFVDPSEAAPPASGDRALTDEDAAPGSGAPLDPDAAGQRADIAKIRARRDSLFPFLTLDLQFLPRLEQALAVAREKMVNPLAARASRLPPLRMSGLELQDVIDRSWSRRDRWRKFAAIAALVTAHDADEGAAPALLRAYLDQNQLQPFCDGRTRDRRFWATLENVADHADFIDSARSFARDHPSSKTTTELLFMLDELAQASRDARLMLLGTVPEQHLPRTEAGDPEGFILAGSLRAQYAGWLTARGLITAKDIRARYDDLRLRLLSTILETTPEAYRAADAQYLTGEILFNDGNVAAAERLWRAITPDPSDAYHVAYAQVRSVLETPPVNHRDIRRALDAEYGRWRVFSYGRLRQFGQACDTY